MPANPMDEKQEGIQRIWQSYVGVWIIIKAGVMTLTLNELDLSINSKKPF